MSHDDWIIGGKPDSAEKIIVHISDPWFCCSYADTEQEAHEFFGLTVNNANRFFYNFRWADGLPGEAVIRQLCAEADNILLP
jgi:hypothetical protein